MTHLNLTTPATVVPMTEKRCSGCLRMVPLSQFNHNRRTPDGKRSACRNCEKVRLTLRPTALKDLLLDDANLDAPRSPLIWREIAKYLIHSMIAFENDPDYRQRMIRKYVGRA